MPFIQANDLNVHYVEHGNPTGEPIVFVHGNWSTSSWWLPVMDLLPQGYRGIAYDMRGRGQTEGPDSQYTMQELAGDLRALTDALGLSEFHMVGHSLGSAVAMQFALEALQSVKSLTILSPAWVDGMPEAYNFPAGQQAIKSDRALFAGSLKALAPTVPDDDFWQKLVIESHGQRIEAALLNLPALVAWKPGDTLRVLGDQTLVVSGDLDPLTGGPNAERAAAALGARHVVMQGVGHSPNVEAPDDFVRLLVEHISGLEKTSDMEAAMSTDLLPGLRSEMVKTERLAMHVLMGGRADGDPVVFLHGNVSSSRFWEETLLSIGAEYRVLAPDLRGYGETEALAIDATRGLGDWSDDLDALARALNLGRFHIVGWSMGAGVAMQYAIDHSDSLLSMTLVAAMSPYGFGGTKDLQGTPTQPDFAGSGGGTVNPEFAQRLAEGDRSGESPLSPRGTMNAFYFKPPFTASPEREEVFVSAMLSTRSGDGFYPGDMTASEHWPNVAPGTKGINNAMSPKYCDLSRFSQIHPTPSVLWVRGADDAIVSDTSLFDFGFLGQIGAVPGWPGAEVYPPQPMVSQLRAVLDRYSNEGGSYMEIVIPDCGHSPHVEKPEIFADVLRDHLHASR